MSAERNPDLTQAVWKKSTRSGSNGGACVEVARNLPGIVAVRDSKDPNGPALVVASSAWSAFAASVQAR
ncbi:hypothetical protein Athai_68040 [Actinocatenispora thailandica]|uniref:DUF397 domain-containing protein n=1 Tax=Actinocatenispora thailandica TaxID=227318 RepID=A0A7R7DWT2_9ACTN|nr:DUF397 domain-containing protein [Actinocatenispora thailandica]BCJ39301.1 hypothetical protein Athai_68040 [Actinocatenispora thailandica]